MTNKQYITKAKSLLNEFCMREYESKLKVSEFKEITKIPIMYTEYSKSELEGMELYDMDDITVQVYINLKDYKITIEYNNNEVYSESHESMEKMLEVLESLDFDSYCNLEEIDAYINL